MELLQNSTAQWIAGIVVSLISGFLISRYYSKTRKDLSYRREIWPLVQDEVGSRLQLQFDHEPVENVAIVVIHLSYKGNEPIRRDDYEQTLTFDFHDQARVLDAEVLQTEPTNMNPVVISETDTKVRLNPILLNDGNRITIKMLVENAERVPKVDGRIAGVNKLRDTLAPIRALKPLLARAGLVAIITNLSALIVFALVQVFDFSQPTSSILLVAFPALGGSGFTIWIASRLMSDLPD